MNEEIDDDFDDAFNSYAEDADEDWKPLISSKTLYKVSYVFAVIDKKIKTLKNRYDKPRNIETIDDLNQLISQLIIHFEHPIYLPTLDEARMEELKLEISQLLENVSWKRKELLQV